MEEVEEETDGKVRLLSWEEAEREYERALAEEAKHRAAEAQLEVERADATVIATIRANPHALEERHAFEESIESEREVAANRATVAVMERDRAVMFAGLDSDDELMPWIRRGTHDAEASGSSKVPVIDISSDEEWMFISSF